MSSLRSLLGPYLFGALLILCSYAYWRFSPTTGPANLESQEQQTDLDLSWRLLQTYGSGKLNPDLAAKVDQAVRIPGFAVPLDADFQAAREFLFVPNQLACIHVPPPPPYLMIHVKLAEKRSMEELSGPLWLSGVLRLAKVDSVYGASLWSMDQADIKPYE